MELFEAIKTRRSIRKYKNDSVPEEVIKKIIDAARWAPSAKNRQHWYFIIIKDKKLKNEIGENWANFAKDYFRKKSQYELQEEFKNQSKDFSGKNWIKASQNGSAYKYYYNAPILIAVAINNPEIENNFASAFLTIQNLALAAHSLGLGTCITRRIVKYKEDRLKVQRILKIPDDHEMVALITLGYPEKTPKSKRKKINEIIHYNYYGNKS